METVKKRLNYFGSKLLIDNMKVYKEDVLNKNPLLKTFLVSHHTKDVVTKTYYDTPDNFFLNSGINIHLNIIKGKPTAELVIRYDSVKERINFLVDMPETFSMQLSAKDNIRNHLDDIAYAVNEIVPSGLYTNVDEKVRELMPFIVAKKKRDRYKAVSNSGLKMILSFDNTEYSSPRARHKVDMDLLEISSESDRSLAKDYDDFIKNIILEKPYLVKLKNSDLFIGVEYLI